MRLTDLVETSAAVASVPGRLDKIGRLAELLARLAPDEIAMATAYLAGDTCQGRLGVGPAAIGAAAAVAPAATPSLTLRDVDAAFETVAGATGAGSAAARAAALRALL
jgi:DNA ligase-1